MSLSPKKRFHFGRVEVREAKIMWTFFPGEQILCPLHGGVPKERFYCNFRQQKKFILTVADDPSYLLRANLLWSLLIGVSSPISFSRAVF